VSSWFSRSGASPPSFHESPLISARIGVPSAFRISSQTGDRVPQQIRSFNFQLVPNGERIRVPAAWCVRRKPRIPHPAARTQDAEIERGRKEMQIAEAARARFRTLESATWVAVNAVQKIRNSPEAFIAPIDVTEFITVIVVAGLLGRTAEAEVQELFDSSLTAFVKGNRAEITEAMESLKVNLLQIGWRK
jgi:hypothetical protein